MLCSNFLFCAFWQELKKKKKYFSLRTEKIISFHYKNEDIAAFSPRAMKYFYQKKQHSMKNKFYFSDSYCLVKSSEICYLQILHLSVTVSTSIILFKSSTFFWLNMWTKLNTGFMISASDISDTYLLFRSFTVIFCQTTFMQSWFQYKIFNILTKAKVKPC